MNAPSPVNDVAWSCLYSILSSNSTGFRWTYSGWNLRKSAHKLFSPQILRHSIEDSSNYQIAEGESGAGIHFSARVPSRIFGIFGSIYIYVHRIHRPRARQVSGKIEVQRLVNGTAGLKAAWSRPLSCVEERCPGTWATSQSWYEVVKYDQLIYILHSSEMSSSPVWAEGLKKCGTYYGGYAEDLEGTLELHQWDTVTTCDHRGNNPHLEKQTRKMNPKKIVSLGHVIQYLVSVCKQYVVWE